MSEITLYHGSEYIIEHPVYGAGNPHNDYGLGFYCTEDPEMAKEWACTDSHSGFANSYKLNTSDLGIMNMADSSYHILNWLAILVENRVFSTRSDLAAQAKAYLSANFLPDYRDYDVIIGYRADDSYFSFANAFLGNAISLDQLEKAMYLGNLGMQTVIISEKAFSALTYQGNTPADRHEYYPKRKQRDDEARNTFHEYKLNPENGIYMIDIIRQKWRNDDARLQRIISR